MDYFSLLSVGFLGLASAAVVALGLLRGRLRELAFLGLNLIFLGRYLLGWKSTATVVVFTLLGYGLIEATRRGVPRVLSVGSTVLVVIFVYLLEDEFSLALLDHLGVEQHLMLVLRCKPVDGHEVFQELIKLFLAFSHSGLLAAARAL